MDLLLDGEEFDILWDEPGPSTEELDLQELEENPNRVSSFISLGPTDATYADRLGTALQKGDCMKKLVLDFSGWTKWSALEVSTFLEKSTSLEELTFRSPEAEPNMTTMRTLSSILEAVASNSTANIKYLALMSLPLQGKCVGPFCQILQDTKTIQTLELDMTLFRVSDQEMDRMAAAFGSNNTLKEISINRLPNKAISLIFSEMSKHCPSTLKNLRFTSHEEEAGNQIALDTKGLGEFLVSPNCRLEQLHLSHVSLDEENSEALLRGLLGNGTLQELGFRHCIVHEPHFARILQEMTQPHRLELDCQALEDPANVITALQRNTSLAHCELYNLRSPCGAALREVFSHNNTLQDLHLYWFATATEDDEFQPPTDSFAEEIQLLSEGLRVNRTINALSFHNFGFDEEGIHHLATALCPPSPESPNTNDSNGSEIQQPPAVYSLIDLSLVSGPVSDNCLKLLAKPLRMPECRLRSLSVQLEDAPSAFYTKGIVKLFEAVGQNRTLEYLQIGSSAVTVQGLDPLVLQNLARALRGASKLQKLDLNVGFNSEVTWRASSRNVVRCIYAAWLAALAGNFSLHSVQFGNIMYGHLSVDDKEFWTAVSFFGLRNRLISRLQNDEISSVTEAMSLAQSMVIDELGNHRPWTLPSWQIESDPARHSLTELSLFFLCMRMMPHLLTDPRVI